MKLKKFTVSSLTNYIKVSLESDILLSNINVSGEVSNFKKHSNGNIYFSLKDDACKINCVIFTKYMDEMDIVDFKDGEKIDVLGKISVYSKEGSYQIICYMVEKQGVGDLHKEFEKLMVKLREKGYFDESNKKQIPSFSFNIGVITSKTGAVIQDILNVAKRKNPFVNIKIFDSLVQGIDAYKDIIQGIRYFNIENNVDVIIIARGGGSIEDLWTFNNEILAEEIYKSKIPIVSGVGHETDFTICDFVSDLRASTPTASADICIPDMDSILFLIDSARDSLNKNMDRVISNFKNRVYEYKMYISSYSPKKILNEKSIKINNVALYLNGKMKDLIFEFKDRLNELRLKLEKNDINQILDKGFVLVCDEDLNIIKDPKKMNRESDISLMFKNETIRGKFIKKEV